MLGYIALIFIIYLSIKLSLQLSKHKKVMIDSGVSSVKFKIFQYSSYLYIVSLTGFILPFPWLSLISPIPTGFLLLAPGIILGKIISSLMERSGVDVAVNAGRAASKIMWLGIATGIFIAVNLVFWTLIDRVGNDIPV